MALSVIDPTKVKINQPPIDPNKVKIDQGLVQAGEQSHKLSNQLGLPLAGKLLQTPFGKIIANKGDALLDLVTRANQAMLARHARPGTGMQTFIHGQGPNWGQQYQADIVNATRDYFGADKYDKASPTTQWVAQQWVAAHYDPTILGGIASRASGLAGLLERAPLAGAVKLGGAIEEHAPQAVKPITRGIARVIHAAHNYSSVDANAKRALVRGHGMQWLDKYAELYATRAHMGSVKNFITHQLTTEYKDSIQGLNKAEEAQVYQALDKGTVDQLTGKMKTAGQRIERLTDTLAYLEANGPLRKRMLKEGFELPEWAKPLDNVHALVRQKISQYRKAYLPGMQPGEDLPDLLPPGMRRTGFFTGEDPFLRPRKDLPPLTLSPEDQRKAFQARFSAGAKNVAEGGGKRRVEQIMGQAMPKGPVKDVNDIRTFFSTMSKVGPKDLLEYLPGVARTGVDLQKGAFFFSPFGHMKNIGWLQAIRNPLSLPATVIEYIKMMPMSESARFRAYAPEIVNGAIQISDKASDRNNSFTSLLGWMSHHTGGDLPIVGRLNPFRIGKGWYEGVADQLWKFDDAAKATAFREYVKRGETPTMAAYKTNAHLVDYNTRSKLAEDLGYIMPFAVWGTKAPMAVAHSIGETPEASAALARMFPSAFGGTTQGTQPGFGSKLTTPMSEASQLISDFPAWLRGRLSDPVKAGLNIAGVPYENQPGSMNPWTFGYNDPLKFRGKDIKLPSWMPANTSANARYLLEKFPTYAEVKDLMGKGQFKEPPAVSVLNSSFGLHESKLPNPPKVQTQRFHDYETNWRQRYQDAHPGATTYDVNNQWNKVRPYIEKYFFPRYRVR